MNPRTYRKRPILIEAMGPLTKGNAHLAHQWVTTAQGCAAVTEGLVIQTLEGAMLARYGDYVIRGAHGEFYPCKPDVFATTYDAATGADVGGPTTVVKSMEAEIQHLRHHLRRIANEAQEALEEAQ